MEGLGKRLGGRGEERACLLPRLDRAVVTGGRMGLRALRIRWAEATPLRWVQRLAAAVIGSVRNLCDARRAEAEGGHLKLASGGVFVYQHGAMIDRRAFYDQRAAFRVRETDRHYQQLLRRQYAFWVPPGLRVLEVGCSLGDLLAAVKPARGVGVDFSPAMISLARQRHPELEFQVADAAAVDPREKFDYILLADLVNDLPDVQAVFERLQAVAHPRTRLVVSFFNNLWRPVLNAAARLGLKSPTLLQNWLSTDDVHNLLHLAGWEVVRTEARILWPVWTPFWSWFCNRWLAPLLPDLCFTIGVIARPRPQPAPSVQYHCSVVVPARNEAGNIEEAVRRTPEMGQGTELIFIEGHSTDDTWGEIQRVAAKYPQRNIKVLKQQSRGKGGAVREAFAAATGDLLFILDADLTMPPEELPKFYEAARSGTAEFVNGVRLVYPMEDQAMQFLNMLANKVFGLTFSWLLGQKIKDTLCGTKVLFRMDYEAIARNRALLRRLRSVRRLRPAVRRGQAQPAYGGFADPLSRADLRADEHPPLEPRLAVVADGVLRRAAAQIHPMTAPLAQHQAEIERNLRAWNAKPLLKEIYAGFYRRILGLIDPAIPGRIVEIGSGIGNLKAHLPGALATDLFPNPWLDVACDGYELPFRRASLSHLVLFDVFHHLRAPNAFLREARRVLVTGGRLVSVRALHQLEQLPGVRAVTSRGGGVGRADQPRRIAAAAARLLCRARQRDTIVLPEGNPRLAGRLEDLSRGSLQLLPLSAVGRLQQTRVLPGKLAGRA